MSSGSIRRAQLVSPFGVGAMSVLVNGTSVITAGLDHWFGIDDPSLFEHVVGTGGERVRALVRKQFRAHQGEVGQAHGFHRTRGRSDVFGQGGVDQNDAHGAQEFTQGHRPSLARG